MARIYWTPLLLVPFIACSFSPEIAGTGPGDPPDRDAGDVDAPLSTIDSGIDAPPGCTWSYDPAHFVSCDLPEPQGGLVLGIPGVYRYDTDTGMLFEPDGSTLVPHATLVLDLAEQDARVASVDGLEIRAGSTLRVEGSLPLIVASRADVTVVANATIDAGSPRIGASGAGANPAVCASHAATRGDNDSGGGAGSGGGGFGGRGGRGGNGDSDGGPSTGGSGGNAVAAPSFVRGGCAGATGGDGDSGAGGSGGNGGGAIQLTSQTAIRIGGLIHAGGGGGTGGTDSADAGGGGGGSGGYIGLDAPEILIDNGVLAANGGGGGEGSNGNDVGNSGADGRPDAQPANGGAGSNGAGADGGAGSAANLKNGQNVTASGQGGGGGGGGAAGYILVFSTPILQQTPTISPSATKL